MKIEKSVIFVKENFKINIWKRKNIVMVEIIVIVQEDIELLHKAYVI